MAPAAKAVISASMDPVASAATPASGNATNPAAVQRSNLFPFMTLSKARMWRVSRDERHRDALAASDLVLIFLGGPSAEFIGRAEVASKVHEWTPAEAGAYPGDSPSGVLLSDVPHSYEASAEGTKQAGSCQDPRMAKIVPDGDPEPQEPRPGDTVIDAPQVCLRCDWAGRSDSKTCPRCEAPLYRLREFTEPVGLAPAPSPRAHTAGDPIPGPPVEAPQPDDDVPRAAKVAVSRRWWLVVGAFTVTALWIVAPWRPIDRLRAPDEPPTASPVEDASPTDGVLRRDDEVLRIEGADLVAVDPDSGESRTVLDLGARTDPPSAAVGGEVIRGAITTAAWSPDGRWVAFDGPDDALAVMNAEGHIRRLAAAEYGGWAWSPTEAQLAMVLNSNLTVIDASTARKIDLGEVIGDVTSAPVWSPDGTRILFGARGGSLYSVDVGSAQRSLLVRLPGENLDSMDEIEWSPDGAHILVMNDLEPGGGRLYVINADGSGVRVLRKNYQPGGLAWSPDGDSIAYVSHDATTHLQTISPIGGSSSIAAASADIGTPVWSPDGGRIGFRAWAADGSGWYAVDPDGAGRWLEINELTYLSWRGGLVYPSL